MSRMARIRIDPLCNNNCIYCLSGKDEQKKYSEYKTQMKEALNEGKDRIVILGGEPTLRDDILDIVSSAKEAGFKGIIIPTNARLLSNREFAVTLIERGVTFFVVKLWGHNAEIHEKITRTKGSFEQTVEGIKNIVSCKGDEAILGKTGILQDNYKYLPDLAEFFAGLGVKWMNFELPLVENRLVPLVPETLQYIYESLETADRLHTYLQIMNIPFCLMRGYEDHVPTDVVFRDRLEDCGYLDFVKPRYNENKAKKPQCEQCKYFSLCEGMWKKYLKEDCVSEINPIKRGIKGKMLERIDELVNNAELFSPLVESKEIPSGLQADAIAHFSGGVDSTVSAAIYARQNKEKKIVLITYCHSGLRAVSSSRMYASHLMNKYPNIVAHLCIPLLEELHVPLCFGSDYKEHVMKLKGNYGCIACKLLMYACSIYLLKSCLKGDTIVAGNNLTRVPGRSGPPLAQIPEVVSLMKDFASYYDIQCINPIYSVSNKQRVVLLAKGMNLPTVRVTQSRCILGYPVPCEDIDPMIQFVNEKILPIVRNILEINLKRMKEE